MHFHATTMLIYKQTSKHTNQINYKCCNQEVCKMNVTTMLIHKKTSKHMNQIKLKILIRWSGLAPKCSFSMIFFFSFSFMMPWHRYGW